MLPLLQSIRDGAEVRARDLLDPLAKLFSITDEEREKLIASGGQRVFDNRVFWSVSYLSKAGLLARPRRGVVQITSVGKQVLDENPSKIDIAFLSRFPSFVQFKTGIQAAAHPIADAAEFLVTPQERVELGWQELRRATADELLAKVKATTPQFFERLVVELLVAMGYGGNLADAGRVVGKPGDQGIDGVIKEDKLGLDLIYVQAKRWTRPLGRPDVQAFAGSLDGARARRGVMITTSAFSTEARAFVGQIEKKIVLIDGQELVDLMIEHGVAVQPVKRYDIYRVDHDYFDEE